MTINILKTIKVSYKKILLLIIENKSVNQKGLSLILTIQQVKLISFSIKTLN